MLESPEHILYLKKKKYDKALILFFQIAIIFIFLISWELLSHFKIINTFLSSSPSEVVKTIISLLNDKSLFSHITITLYETFISFIITSIIGFLIAILMWFFPRFSKTNDTYLTIINALPIVSLGHLIIICLVASTNSIIFMALLISLFITIINIYNGFNSTNENYIKLLKSLNASKICIFLKVVMPSNIKNLISTMKINISMTLIGILPPVRESLFLNRYYSKC